MIRVMAEQAVGIAAILAVLYWWTGLPEATALQVALSFAVLAACAAGFIVLAVRGVRRLRPVSPVGIAGWLGTLLAFAMGLRFATWIAWWVPQTSGFTLQAASMVLRFGLGYFVAVASWAGLLRAIASGIPRSSQESTAARP